MIVNALSRNILAILFLTLSFHPRASEQWSGFVQLGHLYPSREGLTFTSSHTDDISTCDNGRRFIILIEHPNYQVMSSTLLTAWLVDANVSLNYKTNIEPLCGVPINRIIVRE
ncbi:hypothetical protein GCM10023333_08780 [Ferrimonas pelagia]|uniref:Uncharacterized protein n=1 Tax=Ferrimonas pelagia TaxID=1177826 RepID=A0ABP9EIG1_9GAMM